MNDSLSMKATPLKIGRWFLAEFIGTMLLAATVGVASLSSLGVVSGYTSLYLPFAVGAVVMVLVYLLGHVSGGHFNPAVSVGLMTFRKITWEQFVSDLIAQFLGAWVGLKLVIALVGVGPTAPSTLNHAASLGEFIGASLLVFAVTTVVLGRVKAEMGGLVIGAALVIGITLSMVTGGGVLNPAVAIAFGASAGTTYLVMPLLGGLVGASLAVLFDDRALSKEK